MILKKCELNQLEKQKTQYIQFNYVYEYLLISINKLNPKFELLQSKNSNISLKALCKKITPFLKKKRCYIKQKLNHKFH